MHHTTLSSTGSGHPRGGARSRCRPEPSRSLGDVRRSKVQEAGDAAPRPEGTQDDPHRRPVVLKPNRYHYRGDLCSNIEIHVIIPTSHLPLSLYSNMPEQANTVLEIVHNFRPVLDHACRVWRILPQPSGRRAPRHHVPLRSNSGKHFQCCHE